MVWNYVTGWLRNRNAIGIIIKAGRYGGTYDHKDIAYEFIIWISKNINYCLLKKNKVIWIGMQDENY